MPSEHHPAVPSALDHPALPALHERHRRCLVRQPGGALQTIEGARRITLGFDKLYRLIEASNVSTDHVVLSMFAGPGGLARLLSLLRPRLLIAADILYAGPLPSATGWHFDIEAGFDAWTRELRQQGIAQPRNLRRPLAVQMDVRSRQPALVEAVDSIFIDPPFGNQTESLLGINEAAARALFVAALDLATTYLRPGGEILCCIPVAWTLDENWSKLAGMQAWPLSRLGDSGRLAVARLTRCGDTVGQAS